MRILILAASWETKRASIIVEPISHNALPNPQFRRFSYDERKLRYHNLIRSEYDQTVKIVLMAKYRTQ